MVSTLGAKGVRKHLIHRGNKMTFDWTPTLKPEDDDYTSGHAAITCPKCGYPVFKKRSQEFVKSTRDNRRCGNCGLEIKVKIKSKLTKLIE